MSDAASDEWYTEVYLAQQNTGKTTGWDFVIEDIKQREEMGALKYGKYLTPNTHEDMLQHLYEELLDATVYIKTLLLQREHKKKPSVKWERDNFNRRDCYTITYSNGYVESFYVQDSFKNAEGFGKILELRMEEMLLKTTESIYESNP